MKPKIIFVCSPFRPSSARSLGQNINYAKAACHQVFAEGHIPFAPHLFYPCFLNEFNPQHRSQGIAAGIALLLRCDELWAFIDHGTSEGMQYEIGRAIQENIPVSTCNLSPISPPLEEKSSQSQKTY